jgi:ferredoxin
MAVRLLQIDPIACDAFGYCAELAPELITLDEWGYPVVDAHPVPIEFVDTAQAAIRSCPRQAIRLVKLRSPSPERVALRSSNRHPTQSPR